MGLTNSGSHDADVSNSTVRISGQAGRPTLLIVEDEPVSRRALAQLLNMCGHPAEVAGSAEEALRVSARRGVPRVALVDIDLPGMNGLELIRQLKLQDPSFRAIVLSACMRQEVLNALRDRRIPHLAKPIDVNQLLHMLNRSDCEH